MKTELQHIPRHGKMSKGLIERMMLEKYLVNGGGFIQILRTRV